jgi:Flp pilus assembly protein TadB
MRLDGCSAFKSIHTKIGIFAVLLPIKFIDYGNRSRTKLLHRSQTVGNQIVSEILETIAHNLCVGATLLECVESESQQLQPEVRNKLALIHVGLAMALDALQSTELQACGSYED